MAKPKNKRVKRQREVVVQTTIAAEQQHLAQRHQRVSRWLMGFLFLLVTSAISVWAHDVRTRPARELEARRTIAALEQQRTVNEKREMKQRQREEVAEFAFFNQPSDEAELHRYTITSNIPNFGLRDGSIEDVPTARLQNVSTDIADPVGGTPNPFLFNGQYQDETGLYYLRARHYNPANGRFLSHDPVMGNSDDPVSLHRYLYAANDPVNGTDPGGRETLIGAMSALGIHNSLQSLKIETDLDLLSRSSSAAEIIFSGTEFAQEALIEDQFGDSFDAMYALEYALNDPTGAAMAGLASMEPIGGLGGFGGGSNANYMGLSVRGLSRLTRNPDWFRTRRFWRRVKTFKGNKVFQRNDLIDPDYISRDVFLNPGGETNLQRMERGVAPFGEDDLPINLHHLIQTETGAIAEVSGTFHQKYHGVVHIDSNTPGSSNVNHDSAAWKTWKRRYWKDRARDFGLSPQGFAAQERLAMSMKSYRRAVTLMRQYPDEIQFLGPVSPEDLSSIEESLSVELPATYRQFLQEYGGGSFGSVDVYGLTFENLKFLIQRYDEGFFPKVLLPVGNDGAGGWYCLDLRAINDNEAPVVNFEPGSLAGIEGLKQVASNFGDYLLREVEIEIQCIDDDGIS